MKTIDELWYGNLSPFEQCTRGDKRLKELLKLKPCLIAMANHIARPRQAKKKHGVTKHFAG